MIAANQLKAQGFIVDEDIVDQIDFDLANIDVKEDEAVDAAVDGVVLLQTMFPSIKSTHPWYNVKVHKEF